MCVCVYVYCVSCSFAAPFRCPSSSATVSYISPYLSVYFYIAQHTVPRGEMRLGCCFWPFFVAATAAALVVVVGFCCSHFLDVVHYHHPRPTAAPPYSCVGNCPLTTNTAAIGEEDVGEVGFDPPCSASSPARSRSGGVTEAKEVEKASCYQHRRLCFLFFSFNLCCACPSASLSRSLGKCVCFVSPISSIMYPLA